MAEIKTGWLVDFEDNVFAPQTLFSQVRKDDTGDTLKDYLNAQISAINSSISAVSAQVGAEATARDNADKAIKELTLLADLNSETAGRLDNGAIGIKNTLPVKHGGTGATTLTANQLIIGNGTSAVTSVVTGTTTQLLGSNGTKPVYYSVSLTSGQNTPETTGPYVKFKINNVEAATVDIPIATTGTAGVVITGTQTFSGAKTFSNTTQSTSKDTGAVIIEGGVGIEKNLWVGGTINITAGTNKTGINMNDTAITNASGYSSNISKWYFIDNNNETIAYIDENGITAHDIIVNATKLSDFMSSTNTSLTTLSSSKAPNNHASASTTYGVGNASNYGHLMLSDDTASSKSTSDGVAATPAAVKSVADALSSQFNNLNNNKISKGVSSIELNQNDSLAGYGGFIDFHYRDDSGTLQGATDYTSRIIEDEEGVLLINGISFNASTKVIGNAKWGTTEGGTITLGSATKPIYLNAGTFTECNALTLTGTGSATNGTYAITTNYGGSVTIPAASSSVVGLVSTGDQTFGGKKAFANNVAFGSYIASNVIPSANNSYDLGSSTYAWKDIYAYSIDIGNSTEGGLLFLNSDNEVTLYNKHWFSGLHLTNVARLEGEDSIYLSSPNLILGNGMYGTLDDRPETGAEGQVYFVLVDE